MEPPVRLTGATSTDALAANPTLAGLDECARLAHKPLRSFIQVRSGAISGSYTQLEAKLCRSRLHMQHLHLSLRSAIEELGTGEK